MAFDPVNVTPRMEGWQTSSCPRSAPLPVTRFRTPLGRLAASNTSTILTAVQGVRAAGLKTTVLPKARAGAIFHKGMATGKFQGVMAATTPSGTRVVNIRALELVAGITSPVERQHSPA